MKKDLTVHIAFALIVLAVAMCFIVPLVSYHKGIIIVMTNKNILQGTTQITEYSKKYNSFGDYLVNYWKSILSGNGKRSKTSIIENDADF